MGGLQTDTVRRAQQGDRDAFESLVTREATAIFRLARAYVDDGAAEDLAQEILVAAWRGLPRLRDPERFGPWLHRIALNHCRSAVRRRGRVREIRLSPAVDPVAPGDFRAAVEARAIVGPAFRRLPAERQALIALHYAAGLSIRACAEVLGVPDGTAKSRLTAALDELRREIGRSGR